MEIRTLDVKVDAICAVAIGVRAVRLVATDGRDLPPWIPGAHIDVRLPNWITRQYSLCSDPEDLSHYRIAVRLEELSRGGSEYIHRFLLPGTGVSISAPRSTLPSAMPCGSVYIAGGVGITAILAMFLRDYNSGLKPKLYYSGRSRSAMAFLDELPAGADVMLAASDQRQRLDLANLRESLPPDTKIAVCGPSGLVTDVVEMFDAERFSVYAERFRAEPTHFAHNTPFTADCVRSKISVPVSAEETLLDALLKADLPVAGGCREGVCGSCEVTVANGEPEHRDLIGAPPGRMYPCVSRSKTEWISLDL